VEEAPTMNRTPSKSARINSGRASIGPKRSCPARLRSAAQHPGLPAHCASSRLRREGEVLVKRQQHTLLVTILAQLEHSISHTVWTAAAPGHRHITRHLLEQASRRLGEKE
jgi:hypothetical protein